jgi:hypothetical protein
VNLFDPGPIRFGDVATARLLHTKKLPQAVVGVYRLDPRDPLQFQAQFGHLMGELGNPYRPAPGLWSTVVVMPGEDEFGLLIGLARTHGKARMDASQAFGQVGGALVEQPEVRALLRGYLRQAEEHRTGRRRRGGPI